MRFDRLDLVRYGRFSEAVLDFGSRVSGGPDLHVVYGPNEAGKTTILNGMLDLLFGIEARSSYSFRHGYDQMRIGGALTIDGQQREYARIKRQQGSLLDGAGVAVGDGALVAALGGLSREACREMFSLDDDTLEKGGKSILESKGDLGQLLFSASAGLADMSDRLARLEAELEAFHAPRARKTALGEAKRRLAELSERRRAIDESASTHAALVEARKNAEVAYADIRQRHADAVKRSGELKAILKALPLIAERDAITHDALGLAAEPDVAALRDAAVTYREQAKDMANRNAECAAADQEVLAVLRLLGREGETEPRRLLLPAPEAAVLKDLAGEKALLDANLSAAQRAVADAREAILEAEAAVGDASPDDGTLDRVKAALADVRSARGSWRVEELKKQAADAAAKLAQELQALAPWTGDADDLAVLAAPSQAEVAVLATALADAEKALALRSQALEKAVGDLARRKAELTALESQGSVTVGAEHPALRAQRDRLWSEHRNRLDETSAEAFEQAMRRDDAAALALLAQSTAIGRLAEARAAEAVAVSENALASAAAEKAEAALRDARAAVANAVAAVSPMLPRTMSAHGLAEWLKRRDSALALARAAAQARRDHEAARETLMALRADLATALSAAVRPWTMRPSSRSWSRWRTHCCRRRPRCASALSRVRGCSVR